MSLPLLDERSLEDLCIAASNLKAKDGRLLAIPLTRIFSAEICELLPAGVLNPTHFLTEHLRAK